MRFSWEGERETEVEEEDEEEDEEDGEAEGEDEEEEEGEDDEGSEDGEEPDDAVDELGNGISCCPTFLLSGSGASFFLLRGKAEPFLPLSPRHCPALSLLLPREERRGAIPPSLIITPRVRVSTRVRAACIFLHLKEPTKAHPAER